MKTCSMSVCLLSGLSLSSHLTWTKRHVWTLPEESHVGDFRVTLQTFFPHRWFASQWRALWCSYSTHSFLFPAVMLRQHHQTLHRSMLWDFMAPCDRLLTNGPALVLNVNANYLQMKTNIFFCFCFLMDPHLTHFQVSVTGPGCGTTWQIQLCLWKQTKWHNTEDTKWCKCCPSHVWKVAGSPNLRPPRWQQFQPQRFHLLLFVSLFFHNVYKKQNVHSNVQINELTHYLCSLHISIVIKNRYLCYLLWFY